MTNLHLDMDLKSFLAACEGSSKAAYGQWKSLLNLLEKPETRAEARQFLGRVRGELEPRGEMALETHHCAFLQQPILDDAGAETTLNLVQFPSTFLPEEWSTTFYQGLMRYPAPEFQGRRVVELGTGNGWISLALARRFLPDCVTGVDINPKAIVCARLNLFLNGLDDSGEPVPLEDGISLVDRVRFEESDLLSHFAGQDNSLHRVVGCIPQVLNPEPDRMVSLISEAASDEELQSLSNYYAQQGHLEDEFGLGLVALAVEQSIPLLKPGGKLIFNMGGRPGSAVLERLMKRRGLEPRRIWQNRVAQAGDTDIEALVAIEKRSPHRFEFFLDPVSEQPVCARAADAYQKKGGQIFHEVSVYEAHMPHPIWTKDIFKVITESRDQGLKSALDLSFGDPEQGANRLSFLSSLAPWINSESCFGYDHAQGLEEFRKEMTEYLHFYHRMDLRKESLVVAPSRRELVANLLGTLTPGLTLAAQGVKGLLPQALLNTDAVLETPNQVRALLKILEKITPDLVITKLLDFENRTPDAFASLVERTAQLGCRLVVDLSDQLHLTSDPRYNGVFSYLSRHELPEHVMLLAGMIHNRVYQDMRLGMIISTHQPLVDALREAGELTYSRPSLLVQKYYAHLLRQLLYFQASQHVTPDLPVPAGDCEPLDLPAHVRDAFSHPALAGNRLAFDENSCRLDFGENELPMPRALKDAVLESYLSQPFSGVDKPDLADSEIRGLLKKRYNLPASWYADLLHGGGVASLFTTLLLQAREEGRPLLVPAGAYGYFVAAARFQNIPVEVMPTRLEDGFMLQPEVLGKTLQAHPRAFVYLNGPLVNPTGALFSSAQINELCARAAESGATLILDTVFTGLEFEPAGWDLRRGVGALKDSAKGRFVLLGGVSKEFSAGGLRWAFAWSTNQDLMKGLVQHKSHRPHGAVLYSVARVLREWAEPEGPLQDHLQAQRDKLRSRALALTEVLEGCGWRVLKPRGGLFLVASPASLLGKAVEDPDRPGNSVVIDGDNISRLLFAVTGVAINNAAWTGIPDHTRFVLSVRDSVFDEALKRLPEFTAWVKDQAGQS